MHDNDREVHELGTILDCPECGGTPDIKENFRAVEGTLFSGVVCDECSLVALHFTTQAGIHLWNEMVQEWIDREAGA